MLSSAKHADMIFYFSAEVRILFFFIPRLESSPKHPHFAARKLQFIVTSYTEIRDCNMNFPAVKCVYFGELSAGVWCKIVYRPWPVSKKASDHMFVNLGFASADNYMWSETFRILLAICRNILCIAINIVASLVVKKITLSHLHPDFALSVR